MTENAKTEEKTEKKAAPAKPTTVNLHWNDDGSLTCYAEGLKLFRLGGEENEEASEDEIDDPEGAAEKRLNRRFKKATGGWKWGRTTHGHNWHTKKQKADRLKAEAAAAAAEKEGEA